MDSEQIEVFSPAKINLFLRVDGKRPDGYHEIFSLMCPVALFDKVTLVPGCGEVSVSCDDPDVPEDETNLAYRAAALFFKKAGINKGASISIKKNIPVAGGLGGGSGNAAAVLTALNDRFGNPFCAGELMAMGLSIGADVPFFILGKPALASGIGEKLKRYDNLTPYKIVLINPMVTISTAYVYKNLDLGLTNCKKKLIKFDFEQNFDAASHLCNDLETVAASECSDIGKAREMLLKEGAIGALMSGSGPTVFGLFPDIASARRAELHLSENSGWKIILTEMIV